MRGWSLPIVLLRVEDKAKASTDGVTLGGSGPLPSRRVGDRQIAVTHGLVWAALCPYAFPMKTFLKR